MDDATAGEIDAALKKVIAKVAPDIRPKIRRRSFGTYPR